MDSTGARGLPESDAPLAAAALWVIAGAVLSGPVGTAIALAAGAGAGWDNAAVYAARYRIWQQAPFWFGIVFVGAWIGFFARVAGIVPAAGRTRAVAAVTAAGIYAAMIVTNYAVQIAYVPALAARGDPALAYLAMANPESFAWVLEMFGYAALGVACWVAAPLFAGVGWRGAAALLLRTNGVANVAGALGMAFGAAWLMAPLGLAAFVLWNLLVVVTMAVIAAALRPARGLRALRQAADAPR